MSLRSGAIYLNKHILNHLTRTFAGRSATPFVMVHHVG